LPGSAVEGKDLVKEFCIKHNLHTFLDIGAGEGTYYFALQGDGIIEKIDGVESWAPYINEYGLREKYNQLFIADVNYFDWEKAGTYDMVLLGDVIEHMYEAQGREVIDQAAKHAKYVVVSLPIYGYYQGWGHDGNWFEAHLEQYSNESILAIISAKYEVLESMKGGTVGVYIFRGLVE